METSIDSIIAWYVVCALLHRTKWVSLAHLWPAVICPSPIFVCSSLIYSCDLQLWCPCQSTEITYVNKSIIWSWFRNTDLVFNLFSKVWEKVYVTQWQKNQAQYSWFGKKYLKNVFQESNILVKLLQNTNALGEGAAGRKETCFHENVGCRIWGIFLISWKP